MHNKQTNKNECLGALWQFAKAFVSMALDTHSFPDHDGVESMLRAQDFVPATNQLPYLVDNADADKG